MPDSSLEKANDVASQLVWVVKESHVVTALQNENLRASLLEELVALHDAVGTYSTKPVLISVAESHGEGQLRIAKTVNLGEAVVRIAAKFECCCEGLLSAACSKL